jgi:GTP cyclohydrolase I
MINGSKSALGSKVHQHLLGLGIETPMVAARQEDVGGKAAYKVSLRYHFEELIKVLGMNPSDDSIKGTPSRLARMWADELFVGLNYDNFPECTDFENKMKYDEVVIAKGINVASVCEHHFIPFIGVAHVGYIPGTKVIGLSKLNRVVDFFARRPQVQERLNAQIAETLKLILETEDVAVVIKCAHMCTRLRGVKDANTETITSTMLGRFREKDALRAEFFSLVGQT